MDINLKNKNHFNLCDLPPPIQPKNKNFENLTNKKFGRLTALYPCGYLTKDRRLAWLCQCDCEKHSYLAVTAKSLKSGNTKSCGCLHKQQAIKSNIRRGKPIEVGNRYYKLTVLENLGFETCSSGKRRQFFKCKCDCGNIVNVAGTYLNTGEVGSCGCIKSKGEQQIIEFLQLRNIKFQKQYSFSDLKTEKGFYQRFDFALSTPKHSLILIEYQGNIHYQFQESSPWNKEKDFTIRKMRDQQKRDYCNKNGIPLYEISYLDNCTQKLESILNKEGLYFE